MSTRTPDTQQRMYPLTWLRAVAALSVVTFHAYQNQRSEVWPLDGVAHSLMLGTDLFVDMFFVLSAFVLWLPLARSVLNGEEGRPGWVMLARRMARLLPLYLTVVVVVWAVTNPTLPGHWQDLLMHVTFTHVYSQDYIFWTNGPAWSLAVEFHFYVLMALATPFVQRAARRWTSRGAHLASLMALPVLCAVAGLAYLFVQITVLQPAETTWPAWFNPLAKAPDFAIGMALAVVAATGVTVPRAVRWGAAVASVSALAWLVLHRPFDSITTNWWHPMFAASIAVGLSAIVLSADPAPRWMSWRPVAWIGGLGYGIYLIHEPVMRVLGSWGLFPEPEPGLQFVGVAVLVIVPTVALAWLSSRTVEDGGLKVLSLIDRRGRRRDYYPHVRHRGEPVAG